MPEANQGPGQKMPRANQDSDLLRGGPVQCSFMSCKVPKNELEVSRGKVCTLSLHTHTHPHRPITSHFPLPPSPTHPPQPPPQTMGSQREATTGRLTKIHRSRERRRTRTSLETTEGHRPYSSTADVKCRLSNTSTPEQLSWSKDLRNLGPAFSFGLPT